MEPPTDKRGAVTEFLRRWTGMGVPMTDEEMDARRMNYLLKKHMKQAMRVLPPERLSFPCEAC